jgi:hypothetical protein
MAEVPFAQQRVPVVGGLGFLTRRTIAILEDAGKEVGFDLVNGVGQGSFCHGPSSCASYFIDLTLGLVGKVWVQRVDPVDQATQVRQR